LVVAKDDEEVAEAIVEAKQAVKIKKIKDPMEKKIAINSIKIIKCKMVTDIKARKINDEEEKEMEEAETEEQVEVITKKIEIKTV